MISKKYKIAGKVVEINSIYDIDKILKEALNEFEIKELNILETPKQFLQILDKAGYYCPDFRQKYVYKKEDKLKNKPVKLINVISKELKNNVEKLNELKRKFDQRLTTSRKEMVECEICITHNPYDIARNVYRQKLDIMYGFRPRYT